jgi:hypothetical protein
MITTRLRIASAVLAVCCWLSSASAGQTSNQVGEVARRARSVARQASGIEQGFYDGEFLLDTSVTIVPAHNTQDHQVVAFDGTNYMVVWRDYRDDDADCDIYGTRVSQSGTVLDPVGIPISVGARGEHCPAISFDGTNFLVVWCEVRGSSHVGVWGTRVSQSGTVIDTAGFPIATASWPEQYPALTFDGTNYLVVWEDWRRGIESDVYGTRVSPSGVVLDSQSFAICAVADTQECPTVSFDGTNYLVVWFDYRKGPDLDPFDIYGARVTQSGTVLDPQSFAICLAAGCQYDPQACFDGTNYLVAWTDFRKGGGDADIYATRVTPAGMVLDTAGIAISTAGGFTPALAFDGDNFLVVWGGNEVCGARVTPAGVVLDTSEITISGLGGDAVLVFDGTNYLVVWNERPTNGWANVSGSRVSPAGTLLDPDGIPIATSAHGQWSPSVSFDGASFLTVWEDYRNDEDTSDIYGARVSQSGVVLDPQGFAISTAPNWQHYPAVSSGGTNALVVWTSGCGSGDDQDIWGARVSQSGVVLDPHGFVISASAGRQEFPAVSFDGTNFLVVWQDPRNASYDIYGARVSPAGEVLDTGGIPISTAPSAQYGPTVSFEGTNFLVVWADRRNGQKTDIYGARLSQSGSVLDSAGIQIFSAPSWQWSPALSFDGTNFLVVWTDNNDTSLDIAGARVSPAGTVLDSSGITISTVATYRSYPAVAFDGTNHLVVWESEYNGSPCIYGVRVTAQGTVVDSGTVVTDEHCAGGAGLAWPAMLALTSGAGGQLFLAYQSRAGTVNGKAYNAQRIWGKMSPAPGIEQEESFDVRRSIDGATIVRGVLFMPEVSARKTQVTRLLDISGRMVLDLHPGANDVRALAPGVYFVREAQTQAQAVRKIVLTE